jgi:hypothetical protein
MLPTSQEIQNLASKLLWTWFCCSYFRQPNLCFSSYPSPLLNWTPNWLQNSTLKQLIQPWCTTHFASFLSFFDHPAISNVLTHIDVTFFPLFLLLTHSSHSILSAQGEVGQTNWRLHNVDHRKGCGVNHRWNLCQALTRRLLEQIEHTPRTFKKTSPRKNWLICWQCHF